MNCKEIEVYLSGYLDGELTQQEAQRVELHLETCSVCPQLLKELVTAQEAARNIELPQPGKQEWKKMENTILENISRRFGWLILVIWSATTVGYAFFQYAASPSEPLFQKILVFGIFLGIALLFFSVLCQRIRESRIDRYKGVQQ
ncbi:MAG TPA: zf-HC2 domain-containing protein [Acidobacteriota bacterium]|nr:zf-HC2 domain-containing protein [Acidobacteriota bacterium]